VRAHGCRIVNSREATGKVLDVAKAATHPERVLLLRHAIKDLQDDDDPNLSKAGRKQAEALADSIPARYGVPDVVFATKSNYHSHRPVQTARPLVDKYNLPFHHDIKHGHVDELVKAVKERFLRLVRLDHPLRRVIVVGARDHTFYRLLSTIAKRTFAAFLTTVG